MAFNAEAFLAALDEIEATKGIGKEIVLEGLKEALAKAFKKELGGDDADVRVNVDPEKGVIDMCHVKKIVDTVEDDFLEVGKDEVKDLVKEGKGFVDGDEFVMPATIEQFRKAAALSVKSMMKQKFAEAEKSILYEAFKDKIGTMITGRVEKVDDRGISVNIVRSSVYLPKNQLIGDERFAVGDTIKLYVNSVEASTKGGARIVVTRSNEGFLRCLFFEEIHEIYDNTILIKNIAREAGERSKVAVWSNDPNVDPAGACIGPNGSRIQKIVGQLGNGSSREKIDIIQYSENVGLFIMEALKPAKVAGIILDEENKSAVAIVKDDSLSLAIGRRGVNARLAVKLTGYKIDIKIESEAIEAGLQYQSFEELSAIEVENKNKKAMELAAAARNQILNTVLPSMPEGYVAPQERVYEEEQSEEENEVLEKQLESEENVQVREPAAAVVDVVPVEVKKEVAPAVEETPAPAAEEVKTQVKTTTSLEELEKNLASESNKQKKFSGKKFSHNKKKDEDEEEDNSKVTDTSSGERMAIYTEEELAEFENEDNIEEDSDEDIDYDDYDEYYDDEK